jgi:AraC-like DNA-binding protein
VPRMLLEPKVGDLDALHGLVLERELPLTAMLAAHIETLVLHARNLTPADAEVAGNATVALISSLVEKHPGVATRKATIASPLRQVMQYINANLHDPELGPAKLTEVFGLSRASLYRMFEQEGGVAELIRTRRLTGAAIQLGAPGGRERRISEIAREWGFADDSSFSRAFRSHFGLAPSDAREGSAQIWARAQGAEAGVEPYELSYWLRTLRR